MSALANISTPRLHIRPFGSDEAGDLRRLTDHPAITGSIDFLSSPFDDDAAVALIARNGADECFLGLWEGDDLVGCVGVHLRAGERIEIGYWIDVARHGRGYASEGVAAVLHALRGRIRIAGSSRSAGRQILRRGACCTSSASAIRARPGTASAGRC